MREQAATEEEPDPIVCPSCGTRQRWTRFERHGRMIWAYPPVKKLTPPVGSDEDGENPYACPECEERTREGALQRMISRRLAACGVPERFRGYSMQRVAYQGPRETDERFRLRVRGQDGVYGVGVFDREAWETCMGWVKYMKGGSTKVRGMTGPQRHMRGASLYIHGPVGVGKTLLSVVLLSELVKGGVQIPVDDMDYADHLSEKYGISTEAAMKEVMAAKIDGRPIAWTSERSYSPRFISSSELIALETLSWKGNPSPLYRFTKHKDGPLVIDDFDSEGGPGQKPREFVVRCMERLIHYRHARRLTTIITSNSSPDLVRENYGERVASRMREIYEPIELTGGGDEWRR